jgi:hypothetical protein
MRWNGIANNSFRRGLPFLESHLLSQPTMKPKKISLPNGLVQETKPSKKFVNQAYLTDVRKLTI